jgi:hypothetical protein
VGSFIATLVLGIGTEVFANSNDVGEGTLNFGQMLPFMKKMPPYLSENELKDMYNSCYDTNGAAPSKNFEQMEPQGMMMNNF